MALQTTVETLRRVALEADRAEITALRWAVEPSAVSGASRRSLEKAAERLGVLVPATAPAEASE